MAQVLTVLLALFIFTILLIRFLPDFNLFMVRSGSMVPSINPGDVIITGPSEGFLSKDIDPGTVITYERGSLYITHRVVSISGDTIVTRGDAVASNDAWVVKTADIVGIYLFRIPRVGYLTRFTDTGYGWMLIIILPTLVLLALLTRDIVREARRKRRSD